MTVSLIGEVVNACDATTGFNQGNISGDDDFVEGSGALGLKCSNATCELFTTTLGAGAPYDFSSGGAEEGDHLIMWFNTKSPINATAGIRITVGDSAGTPDRAHWNVQPVGLYKGGFITKVINPEADFSSIQTGTWTVGGNPAQLTNIDQVGGTIQTTTTIMGSFNNIQIDQITIGTGIRVDAGTGGTPNTFETVRAVDEDTNFWGWMSSFAGAFVMKGGLFIGPATGSATSVFTDSNFSIIFAEENVAPGFYVIDARGGATTVTWTLGSISAANPAVARWDLVVNHVDTVFSDTNSVFSGYAAILLAAGDSLSGTTFIDGVLLSVAASATADGITVLNPANPTNVGAVAMTELGGLTNSTIEFGTAGHGIHLLLNTGDHDLDNVQFVGGYGGTPGSNLVAETGSADAMIVNDTGGFVTLTILNGGTLPSIRNGVGATTQVNQEVQVTFTGMKDNTEVRVYNSSTGAEVAGIEDVTSGTTDDRFFAFSAAASLVVDYVIHHHEDAGQNFQTIRVNDFTMPVTNASIPIQQIIDRNAV